MENTLSLSSFPNHLMHDPKVDKIVVIVENKKNIKTYLCNARC